jgi:dihydroorotase/N-acyl-D-amino-acid deacylase
VAAGHVFAKTGTYGAVDRLNRRLMITGKGLAGYLTTASGQPLSFALYVNRVSVPLDDPMAAQTIAGEALGEIAAAAYELRIDKPTLEAASLPTSATPKTYDVLIRNARVMDGTGNPWYHADVALQGDRVAAIGDLSRAKGRKEIDAKGWVVSPGFIDTLGQSEVALLLDSRSLSKLSQGISSEITGEGGSIAPQNDKTLAPMKPFLDQYHLTVDWTNLDGYFKRLEKDGTPLNLGTYVGAAQIREAVIGDEDRAPTTQELETMKGMVAQAMQEGALGVSTALIYPPGHYAKTEELIALAKVAAQYGGLYATHMRSEGASEEAAINEALRIGREAGLPVEIFHMKVSGKQRWGWMTKMQGMIQAARAGGLDVEGSMYPYGAGGTALASSLPPWVADGGTAKLLERLRDPATRRKIAAEMAVDHVEWENLYHDSGGGSGVMVSSVASPELKQYTGKTIAQIAAAQKKPEMDTLFDFILADKAQTSALYFMAGEQDIQTGLKQPWTSIGLDSNESSLDGPLFEPHTHPRGWGSMPRFLGHYCRDLKLLPVEECVRKITSLPAQRYHLQERGLLKPGYFADVAIWDPATILDKATYTEPNQVSEGVHYLFVNGQLEYEKGQLTGVKAGKVLRGRGYKGKPSV